MWEYDGDVENHSQFLQKKKEKKLHCFKIIFGKLAKMKFL